MRYIFTGFTLDSDKKELSYKGDLVSLTKQSYYLLLHFVQHSQTAINKDELIEKVWNGRLVADNTVDQSIYKLRKTLTDINNVQYFETVYGLGIKFLPVIEKQQTKTPSKKPLYSIIALLIPILLLILWFNPESKKTAKEVPKINPKNSLLMILPNEKTNDEKLWYKSSASPLIEKLLSLSNRVALKNYQDKPDNLTQSEFLEKQWKLYPELEVIGTDVFLKDNVFEVSFSIVNKLQKFTKKSFYSQHLNIAFKQGKEWLIEQIDPSQSATILAELTLDNSYLLEMYMHGLSAVANNKAEQAINFFELCIKEDPDYHVATFELINLLEKKGDLKRALALIDVLLVTNTNPILDIRTRSLRGGIFLRQGKPNEAKEIFINILDKYKQSPNIHLLAVRYKLSTVYRSLAQYDLAFKEMNTVEKLLEKFNNYQTLAEVYQFKGSLHLTTGNTEKAIEYMDKAMSMFVKTDDLYNLAKTHSGMARVYIQQSDYSMAQVHLKQALEIARGLKIKFAIGATLNEVIRVMIAIGKINQANEYNQELEQIAIDIDFTAMLLAAKKHSISIFTIQKKWQFAKIQLKEHFELATAANNKLALKRNKLLELELNLRLIENNNDASNVQLLLTNLQKYIDKNNETKIQPELNVKMARYYLVTSKQQQAKSLLLSSIELAEKIQDGQSLVSINNLLARIYLQNNQPQKALSVLENIKSYKPVAYPYLLLKSKAYVQLKQFNKAIEFASMCKRSAHDLWQLEDETFYTHLKQQKKLA